MPSLADQTIAALRQLHDELADLIPSLTLTQLTGPSGASDWTIAQVLSHLGSGAEIGVATYRAALETAPEPGPDFNQSVWDRWDAMSPDDQAVNFLESDATLVGLIEALTSDQRENLQVKLGFIPSPLSVATIAGMRLNEVALHAWDIQVALNAEATLNEGAAEILAQQLSGAMDFMLGFIGKADALPQSTVVDAHGFGLVIDQTVSLAPKVEGPTATFEGPIESLIRLIGGRLSDANTPAAVKVEGNVSLKELRLVFPGF
jgi:uncharacterized protein (TIGR03083 family)